MYPGFKKYNKLAFVVRLNYLKCLNGWTDKSFNMVLQLFHEVVPNGKKNIPSSYYEAKRILAKFGLDFEKIDACINDCMLFWREFIDDETCHICGESRWDINKSNLHPGKKGRKIEAKILFYFPLIPRLKRLYMMVEIDRLMRWHYDGRSTDGEMHHPVDIEAWKAMDRRYPNFAADPRNIHLGLASDGFSLFGSMTVSYGTRSIILTP